MDGAVGGFNIRMEGDCPSITVLPLSTREAIIITRQIGFVCGEYGAGFIGWIKERLRENYVYFYGGS